MTLEVSLLLRLRRTCRSELAVGIEWAGEHAPRALRLFATERRDLSAVPGRLCRSDRAFRGR